MILGFSFSFGFNVWSVDASYQVNHTHTHTQTNKHVCFGGQPSLVREQASKNNPEINTHLRPVVRPKQSTQLSSQTNLKTHKYMCFMLF